MKKQAMRFLLTLLFFGNLTTGYSQLRFGAKAGLNLADQSWNGFGGGVETLLSPSYMIGGIVEYDYNEILGIGAGLELQGKGTNDRFFKTIIHYVEIPVYVHYRNNGWFAALGPYVSYALGGKYKQDGGDTIELSFGNGNRDDFTSVDYGIGIEGGYEFRQIRITGSYTYGLANNIPQDVRPAYVDGAFVKNTVMGIALTVLFEAY